MGYISKSLGFLNSYSFLTIIFHILDFGYLFSIYYILNLSRLIFSVSMFFISCILWFCYYSLSIHGYILILSSFHFSIFQFCNYPTSGSYYNFIFTSSTFGILGFSLLFYYSSISNGLLFCLADSHSLHVHSHNLDQY